MTNREYVESDAASAMIEKLCTELRQYDSATCRTSARMLWQLHKRTAELEATIGELHHGPNGLIEIRTMYGDALQHIAELESTAKDPEPLKHVQGETVAKYRLEKRHD